jgi:hypothetical protein
MPRVLNKKLDRIPPGAVYIGWPGKWGNPFVIGRDGTREEVVAKYRAKPAGQSTIDGRLDRTKGQGPRLLVRA